MEVTIRGRNVEVTDRLRAAGRGEGRPRSPAISTGWEHAEVHFFEERNPRISAKEVCEVTCAATATIIRAKAASADTLRVARQGRRQARAPDREAQEPPHQPDPPANTTR